MLLLRLLFLSHSHSSSSSSSFLPLSLLFPIFFLFLLIHPAIVVVNASGDIVKWKENVQSDLETMAGKLSAQLGKYLEEVRNIGHEVLNDIRTESPRIYGYNPSDDFHELIKTIKQHPTSTLHLDEYFVKLTGQNNARAAMMMFANPAEERAALQKVAIKLHPLVLPDKDIAYLGRNMPPDPSKQTASVPASLQSERFGFKRVLKMGRGPKDKKSGGAAHQGSDSSSPNQATSPAMMSSPMHPLHQRQQSPQLMPSSLTSSNQRASPSNPSVSSSHEEEDAEEKQMPDWTYPLLNELHQLRSQANNFVVGLEMALWFRQPHLASKMEKPLSKYFAKFPDQLYEVQHALRAQMERMGRVEWMAQRMEKIEADCRKQKLPNFEKFKKEFGKEWVKESFETRITVQTMQRDLTQFFVGGPEKKGSLLAISKGMLAQPMEETNNKMLELTDKNTVEYGAQASFMKLANYVKNIIDSWIYREMEEKFLSKAEKTNWQKEYEHLILCQRLNAVSILMLDEVKRVMGWTERQVPADPLAILLELAERQRQNLAELFVGIPKEEEENVGRRANAGIWSNALRQIIQKIGQRAENVDQILQKIVRRPQHTGEQSHNEAEREEGEPVELAPFLVDQWNIDDNQTKAILNAMQMMAFVKRIKQMFGISADETEYQAAKQEKARLVQTNIDRMLPPPIADFWEFFFESFTARAREMQHEERNKLTTREQKNAKKAAEEQERMAKSREAEILAEAKRQEALKKKKKAQAIRIIQEARDMGVSVEELVAQTDDAQQQQPEQQQQEFDRSPPHQSSVHGGSST